MSFLWIKNESGLRYYSDISRAFSSENFILKGKYYDCYIILCLI